MSNYTRPLQICEFNKHGCIIWTLETADADWYFFIKLRIWPTADAYMFFCHCVFEKSLPLLPINTCFFQQIIKQFTW